MVRICECNDAETMTEEAFEARLSQSYNVGISVGLGNVAKLMMDEAKELFARGDQDAARMREWARKLERMSKEAHPGAPK